MLPARGFEGSKDCADDGAADPHEGDHDDEPADGDGLSDEDATASLGAATGPAVKGMLLVREERRVTDGGSEKCEEKKNLVLVRQCNE